MSKLKDWISTNNTTQEKFSYALGISYRHLHGVIKGQYMPSRKLASKIEKLTQGAISASELLFPSKSHAITEDIS